MSIKTVNKRGNPPFALLATLAVITVLSPFATDLYLPSFPAIISDLSTDAPFVQLTLTTFLIGVASGQLLFGPLSDRFGRKPPLLIGTAICALASIITAIAPSIEILVAARFAQGFAGAAGIVIARAIVADLYPGAAAARTFSLLAMLTGLAPLVAPLIGGIFAEPLGWRGLLGVVAGLTVTMVIVAVFLVPETNRRGERMSAARAAHKEATGAHGPRLIMLRRPGYVGNTMINALAFAMLMGYIAASPFIFQNMVGLSPLGNGLMFALNSLALIGVNSVNARVVTRVGPRRMMRIGLSGMSAAAVIFAIVVFSGLPAWSMLPVLLVLVASNALVFGNTTALAMQNSREATGTGAAILGAAHFIGGAIAAPIVGLDGEHSAVPLAIVLLVSASGTWLFFSIAGRRSRTADPVTAPEVTPSGAATSGPGAANAEVEAEAIELDVELDALLDDESASASGRSPAGDHGRA